MRRGAVADQTVINDDQVMVGVKAGSIDAFGVLYDRYHDRAYRIARSVCRDEGRAQEAVQETFISIWRTRCNYEDRGAVAPWLMTVARNRAIDIARANEPHARHRATADWLEAIPAPDAVADSVMADDQAHHLFRLLAELPDTQRDVITLAFHGQLTHREIAARLDLPLGTVKGRMRLGMNRLRGALGRVDT